MFGHHKLHNRLVLCSKKDWATRCNYYYCILFIHTLFICITKYPENPFASIYSESLIKTTCQHLLLLVGFDTLIYRKYYDTPPILVGHHPSPQPGFIHHKQAVALSEHRQHHLHLAEMKRGLLPPATNQRAGIANAKVDGSST
jgi:hypothetical protein